MSIKKQVLSSTGNLQASCPVGRLYYVTKTKGALLSMAKISEMHCRVRVLQVLLFLSFPEVCYGYHPDLVAGNWEPSNPELRQIFARGDGTVFKCPPGQHINGESTQGSFMSAKCTDDPTEGYKWSYNYKGDCYPPG